MTPAEEELAGLMGQCKVRALKDPAWFYRTILNFPALAWQVKATNAVLDVGRLARGEPTVINHSGKPRISIRACHGPGKTQFFGMLMHLWNFTTYGKIACTAPKEAQLLRRLLPRYRRCMRDAGDAYKSNIQVLGKEIKCFGDPDWGAIMETASDPDNLAGYHDTPQLFLVDEASARRLDPMFPVIEGALTTPGSVVVEIGNPTREEGEFFNHHNRENIKALYFLMHITPSDAPELVSQAWVDAMAVKYGRESPIFKIRAMGEFAAFDQYTLIPISYLEDVLDEEREEDGSISRLRISIDVSDGGADATSITAGRHFTSFVQILKQQNFHYATGKSPIESAKAGIRMFESFGGDKEVDDFVVDGVGVGAGTVGYLLELGYRVVNFKGGTVQGVDTEQYRNLRVQSYISLYNAFREGSISFLPDSIDDLEELRAHITSIRRRMTTERVDDLEPKDKLLREGLPSPDRADSLSMQYVDRVICGAHAVNQPFELLEASYDMAV